MKASKLFVLGTLLVAIGMTGPAFGQTCSALLTSGIAPTGSTFQVGDTVHYQVFLQVPDVPGACTLTNVSVYYFPAPLGPHTGGDLTITACDHPTDGILLASGLTVAPGDPMLVWDGTDNAALDYVVQASDAGNQLHSDVAFVFNIPGVETAQCDEKASQNSVACPAPCVEITKELVPDSPTFSKVGDTVNYRICIHNCGIFDLTNVVVTDTLLGVLGDFPATLTPDQEVCLDFPYTVQASDPDPLVNEVTVTGTDGCDGQTEATASASFSVDLVQPAITITKECSPASASVGDEITYTITIANTGNVDLENVTVSDSLLGDLSASFVDTLAVGASDTQIFTRLVADTDPTPLVNTATVNATVVTLGNPVSAEASCSVTIVVVGTEGCTPGFWKNNAANWQASAWCPDYTPGEKFSAVFGVTIKIFTGGNPKNNANYITDPTLLQALGANGGGINALARDAVAALLNACSDCVNYGLSTDEVIQQVQEAIAAGDAAIESLHEDLDFLNNAGCPINQQGECVGVID